MGTDRTIHDIKITLKLHFGAAFLFLVKFFRRKILLLTLQFGEALHGSVPNWYCVTLPVLYVVSISDLVYKYSCVPNRYCVALSELYAALFRLRQNRYCVTVPLLTKGRILL